MIDDEILALIQAVNENLDRISAAIGSNDLAVPSGNEQQRRVGSLD